MKITHPRDALWRLNLTLLISIILISCLITQIALAAESPHKNKQSKAQQIRTSIPQKFPDLAIIYIGKESSASSTLRYGNCDSRLVIKVKNNSYAGKSTVKYRLKSGKIAKSSEQHLLLKISKKLTLPREIDLIDQRWYYQSGSTSNFIIKHKFPAKGIYSFTSNVSICLKNGTKCEAIPESNTKNNTKIVSIKIDDACQSK